MSRKDSKNRVLRKGESQRKDGTYMYRYTDSGGKRKCIYNGNLSELRKQERKIQNDIADGIGVGADKISLNEQFDRYMSLKDIANSTRVNYTDLWNNRIRDSDLGEKKLEAIRRSDILRFYKSLKDEGLKSATIKQYHLMISPCLQMAVDDDLIRKNPCNNCIGEFSEDDAKKKDALTVDEQNEFEEFIKNHNVYGIYYPMFVFMIETAIRCGETIGLTWDDVDLKDKKVKIDHQLIYKKKDGVYQFYASKPKTESGARVIPLTSRAVQALAEQRKLQFSRGWMTNVEIDGYSNFVFSTKNNNPIMPSAINNALLNIEKSHNKKATDNIPIPHMTAHILRHTGCTRMAESGIDPKVLQYIMGHKDINITMQVYNHVSEDRCRKEIEKMEDLKAM